MGDMARAETIRELKKFRRGMVKLQIGSKPRSGIYRQAQHLIEELDILATLLVGTKDVLLDGPHKTGAE